MKDPSKRGSEMQTRAGDRGPSRGSPCPTPSPAVLKACALVVPFVEAKKHTQRAQGHSFKEKTCDGARGSNFKTCMFNSTTLLPCS